MGVFLVVVFLTLACQRQEIFFADAHQLIGINHARVENFVGPCPPSNRFSVMTCTPQNFPQAIVFFGPGETLASGVRIFWRDQFALKELARQLGLDLKTLPPAQLKSPTRFDNFYYWTGGYNNSFQLNSETFELTVVASKSRLEFAIFLRSAKLSEHLRTDTDFLEYEKGLVGRKF